MFQRCGADGPEGATQLHISLVGSACNADGPPSYKTVGELALQFIHVVVYVETSFISKAQLYSIVCIHILLCIHLSMDTWAASTCQLL